MTPNKRNNKYCEKEIKNMSSEEKNSNADEEREELEDSESISQEYMP